MPLKPSAVSMSHSSVGIEPTKIQIKTIFMFFKVEKNDSNMPTYGVDDPVV